MDDQAHLTFNAELWGWWPLLPTYPYGTRKTLVRELVADRLWSFEQLHGIWYVAVPIRMTVIKVAGGLLLYAPITPTPEVCTKLKDLETLHGPVCSIILPTTSGLEHKITVPAMARAFPTATVWISDYQWSFPLRLPLPWLGFPPDRTKVLFRDGLPHTDDLEWIALGPLHLGLGTFLEVACFDRITGTLVVTDALVSISETPPVVFELDPLPLLFHSRESGLEPIRDTPELRQKGWLRIVLFANFLRPEYLQIRSLFDSLRNSFAPGCRQPKSHFGFYPFQWQPGWQSEVAELIATPETMLMVAPVLQRLVFPRAQVLLISWIHKLSNLPGLCRLISSHYESPVKCGPQQLEELASRLLISPKCPSQGSWSTLAAIDNFLLKTGIVPAGQPDSAGVKVPDETGE
jgi:hypothetical protein